MISGTYLWLTALVRVIYAVLLADCKSNAEVDKFKSNGDIVSSYLDDIYQEDTIEVLGDFD
jgi:hypothetical protein